MFGLLLTLLILDGILLMVVVLLQAGKGGGLAAMGGGGGSGGTGMDSLMGGRQAATVLTKATWGTGALFLVLALVLSILSSRGQQDTPLLEDEFRSQPVAPQPILPQGEEGGAAPGEGVVPGLEGGAGGAAPEGGDGTGDS